MADDAPPNLMIDFVAQSVEANGEINTLNPDPEVINTQKVIGRPMFFDHNMRRPDATAEQRTPIGTLITADFVDNELHASGILHGDTPLAHRVRRALLNGEQLGASTTAIYVGSNSAGGKRAIDMLEISLTPRPRFAGTRVEQVWVAPGLLSRKLSINDKGMRLDGERLVVSASRDMAKLTAIMREGPNRTIVSASRDLAIVIEDPSAFDVFSNNDAPETAGDAAKEETVTQSEPEVVEEVNMADEQTADTMQTDAPEQPEQPTEPEQADEPAAEQADEDVKMDEPEPQQPASISAASIDEMIQKSVQAALAAQTQQSATPATPATPAKTESEKSATPATAEADKADKAPAQPDPMMQAMMQRLHAMEEAQNRETRSKMNSRIEKLAAQPFFKEMAIEVDQARELVTGNKFEDAERHLSFMQRAFNAHQAQTKTAAAASTQKKTTTAPSTGIRTPQSVMQKRPLSAPAPVPKRVNTGSDEQVAVPASKDFRILVASNSAEWKLSNATRKAVGSNPSVMNMPHGRSLIAGMLRGMKNQHEYRVVESNSLTEADIQKAKEMASIDREILAATNRSRSSASFVQNDAALTFFKSFGSHAVAVSNSKDLSVMDF